MTGVAQRGPLFPGPHRVSVPPLFPPRLCLSDQPGSQLPQAGDGGFWNRRIPEDFHEVKSVRHACQSCLGVEPLDGIQRRVQAPDIRSRKSGEELPDEHVEQTESLSPALLAHLTDQSGQSLGWCLVEHPADDEQQFPAPR
jgi:hypothetical protein